MAEIIELIKTLEETATELSEHIHTTDEFVAANKVKQAITQLQAEIFEAKAVFERQSG